MCYLLCTNFGCVFKWGSLPLKTPSWSSSSLTVDTAMPPTTPPTSLRRSQRLRKPPLPSFWTGGKGMSPSKGSLRSIRDKLMSVRSRSRSPSLSTSTRSPTLARPPSYSSPPSSNSGPSSSPPSQIPGIPPGPFQHLGQGPNGASGYSQPLGSTFFSGAPSVGSIVVNTASCPLNPGSLGPTYQAGCSCSNPPRSSAVATATATSGVSSAPRLTLDLVRYYNPILSLISTNIVL